MENSLSGQLAATISYIKTRYSATPLTGIILGSGIGNFIKEVSVEAELDYSELPYFPVSTVQGHTGKLVFGKLYGKDIVIMAGRFHYYEGYTTQQVVYPVRVMKLLGIENLLISNAAGGVNTSFKVGDLMIITDHISLFTINPLLGKNEDTIGKRFPDMSEPYNKQLITKAKTVATDLNYDVKEGIYCGVTGPSFETRAEYKLIKAIGADAVGMSTVQEVIAAVHAGIKVFAMSVIADIGIREEDNAITHEDVLAAAGEAEPKLTEIFKQLVALL